MDQEDLKSMIREYFILSPNAQIDIDVDGLSIRYDVNDRIYDPEENK